MATRCGTTVSGPRPHASMGLRTRSNPAAPLGPAVESFRELPERVDQEKDRLEVRHVVVHLDDGVSVEG